MSYTWSTLAPDDYRAYRLARYGEAGRCGKAGVEKAATQHGVAIRTWYTYESGSRAPTEAVKRDVARWLNRAVRRDAVKVGLASLESSIDRLAANVEVSLGRPAPPPPLAAAEESTTHIEVPST